MWFSHLDVSSRSNHPSGNADFVYCRRVGCHLGACNKRNGIKDKQDGGNRLELTLTRVDRAELALHRVSRVELAQDKMVNTFIGYSE